MVALDQVDILGNLTYITLLPSPITLSIRVPIAQAVS